MIVLQCGTAQYCMTVLYNKRAEPILSNLFRIRYCINRTDVTYRVDRDTEKLHESAAFLGFVITAIE